MPPLFSFGLDNWNLYALGGMITDESAVGLVRGGGKDSWPEARDEVLALVLLLYLSGDSGKSLHLSLLPHLQGGNTSELFVKALKIRCRTCSSIIQVRSKEAGVSLWYKAVFTLNLLHCSKVQMSSKGRLTPVPTHVRQTYTRLSYQKEWDGKTSRHAHFFHIQSLI